MRTNPLERSFEDVHLSRFLSVRDNYFGHIADFVRYLETNHLSLGLSAVRAYFVHLNASPLAAAYKTSAPPGGKGQAEGNSLKH